MTNLTFAQIDQTVLNTLERPRPRYWLFVALMLCGVLLGAAAWTYQIFTGIGVGGQNIPVAWGTYLINFVFWVGIAHSGTLISAILHLFRAGWRNPIARAAETMTVFAVCCAGLFPFIHLGRVWQVYYMLPIPTQRLLWPNFLSPLMFDVVAISTYLTVSSLFWYTGLVPDLAVVRDRSTGLRYKIFRVPAAHQHQRIDAQVDDDHYRTQGPLQPAGQAGRVDQGQQIIFDEALGVSGAARRRPQGIFQRRQGAQCATELDPGTPYGAGQMQPGRPRPAQGQQAPQHDKEYEGEMREDHGSGGNRIEHDGG